MSDEMPLLYVPTLEDLYVIKQGLEALIVNFARELIDDSHPFFAISGKVLPIIDAHAVLEKVVAQIDRLEKRAAEPESPAIPTFHRL